MHSKNKGPNMNTWGKSEVISVMLEVMLLILTDWFLFKKLSITPKGTPRVPYQHSLCRGMLYLIRGNTLLRSMKVTIIRVFIFSVSLKFSTRIQKMVDFPIRSSCWLWILWYSTFEQWLSSHAKICFQIYTSVYISRVAIGL